MVKKELYWLMVRKTLGCQFKVVLWSNAPLR